MEVVVRAVALQMDSHTRAEVERRIHGVLARLEPRILRVVARVAAKTGPRRGEDFAVSLEVRARGRGVVYVEETDVELAGAVHRAAETAAESLVRTLEKSRGLRKRTGIRPVLGTSEA